MTELTPPPDSPDQHNEDSEVVQQFEAMVKAIMNNPPAHQWRGRPEVFVLYKTSNPDILEIVQQAGELFSRREIRNEFLKTQMPNETFRGRLTKVHKWQNKRGKHIINLSYRPKGINTPFDIGLQVNEDSPWYDQFRDLPIDYQGEIEVKTDENGLIASVSLVTEGE